MFGNLKICRFADMTDDEYTTQKKKQDEQSKRSMPRWNKLVALPNEILAWMEPYCYEVISKNKYQ